MPNEKLKSENYSNFGGVNNKISAYDNGPMEFLNLINVDFQIPGALSARWGSTQYVGQTFPAPIKSLYEYIKLDGSSYVVIGHAGGIWAGATTGNSQGLSLTANVTYTDRFLLPYAGYQKFSNPNNYNYFSLPGLSSYLQGNTGLLILGADFQGTSSASFAFAGINYPAGPIDFVTFQNKMFAASGDAFFKFDGVTTSFVGLPPVVYSFLNAYGSSTGDSNTNYNGQYLGISTAEYVYYASWVNDRGFEGPIWPIAAVSTGTSTLGPGTSGLIVGAMTFNKPSGFGISSINIYYYSSGATTNVANIFGGITINGNGVLSPNVWAYPFQLIGNFSPSATFIIGTTSGGQSLLASNLVGILPQQIQYQLPGITTANTVNSYTGQINQVSVLSSFPKYIEIFGNRMFYSGTTLNQSTVYFSGVGEPEGYLPSQNFEVRTNDGDVVTALKAYNTKLYIFKKNSFYCLYGDTPTNYYLQDISAEYGCLNNRCVVIYDDVLLFLDRKGVVMFDGAGYKVISTPVQPTFDVMNVQAAVTEAVMVHDKIRNQILVSIPINGSTSNNFTVVYDYILGCWTKYNSLSIASLASITGRNTSKNTFYGSYSGSVNWFGSSFLADNGNGFTTLIKSRFIKPLGDSMQEMYRRLYWNIEFSGTTLNFNVNFLQDYGTSFVLQTSMVLSQFQNRIDFGISARSLAFEITNIQTTVRLRVFGFTIESRLQRRT